MSETFKITPQAYQAGGILGYRPSIAVTAEYPDAVLPVEIEFTRNSIASRRNKQGVWEAVAANVPRLHWNIGGTEASWLLEPQRTNLVTYSNDLSQATVYSPVNSSISGTKIVESNTTAAHLLVSACAGSVSGSIATYSAEYKADGRSKIELRNNAGGGGSCFIDLSNGTKYSADSSCTSTITSLGNGWYRVAMTYTPTLTGNFNVHTRLKDSGGNDSYLGDGVSGVLMVNVQFELGAFATSIINTNGSTSTRLADSANSTFADVTEGTLFLDIVKVTEASSTGNPDLSITNAAFDAWCGLTVNTSANPFRITFKNIGTTLIDYQNTNTSGKCAVRFGVAGVYVYFNGVLVASSVTPFNSSFTKVRWSGGNMVTQNKAFHLLGELTGAECIALTTI